MMLEGMNFMEISIKQALEKGIQAHSTGRVKEADRFYTAILKAEPGHPDANHNMGILAVAVGKLNEALPFFRKALDANPKLAQFWFSYIDTLRKLERIHEAREALKKAKQNNLQGEKFNELEQRLYKNENKSEEVNAQSRLAVPQKPISQNTFQNKIQHVLDLYQQGKFQKAASSAYSLLKLNPKSPILYNIVGAANKEQGKLEEAITAYETAISIKSDYPEAYTNMGNALKEQGKLEEAVEAYKTAISIKPFFAEAYNNMGLVLKEQGKLEEAIRAYETAISIKTDYVHAYNNMGNALKDQGKLEEAIRAYETAISIKADYVHAYNNMGTALEDLGRLDEAITTYKTAISIRPNYPEAYNNMGITLEEQGKISQALAAYNKAISLNPNFAEAYNNLGGVLKNQGKIGESIVAYKKAISIKENYAEAYRNLSMLNKHKYNDLHFKKITDFCNAKGISDDERCHYCFTLAKMYEDVDMIDEAFRYLALGNKLRKSLLNYSTRQDTKLFRILKKTQPLLEANSYQLEDVTDKVLPIFILGMPRSGTTLVEQIISSHSKVTGAGELPYITSYGQALATGELAINRNSISEFRYNYLREIGKRRDGNNIITDKMPQNFRFIPLICAALPEAKIVHVTRDAAATCWSNYKHYFVNAGLGYSYNIKDVADYYNLYSDLMKTWNTTYSDRIYNLNYENLTKNQKFETEQLIQYLDIEWEISCLNPENNERNVRTISQQQVRKKLYKGSSREWLKYKRHIGDAFNVLKSI